MKVLLLQSKPFLPVIDGGNEASRALTAELLASGYQVECLTFSSEKHPFDELLFAQSPWNQLNVEHVLVNLKAKPIPAFRALASGQSYNLSRFSHPAWTKKLEEKSSKTYDIVFVDSLFAAGEIENIRQLFPKSKLILRTHNVEHVIWTDHAKNEKSRLKKMYLKSIARQLKRRETEILNQFDLILAISDVDQKTFGAITNSKTELLPYFPDISNDQNSTLTSNFFFLGSMNWTPNADAHEELTQYLFSKINSEVPNTTLTFAGSAQDEITKSDSSNIHYTGFVENKVQFMKESGILLAPISSGSGLRVKILEALALGVPIVTTSKGAAGIPFENENGIFIAKNDHEFIEYAVQLSKDEKLRHDISVKAIKNLVDWKSKFLLKPIIEKYVK